MNRIIKLSPFLLLAAAPLPALAQEQPAPPAEASIPFVNHGGVDDWRAEGSQTIYFRDSHGQWYKGILFMPAFDLPFVETIGIETRGSDTLDKFGTIIVHGQRYPLQSLVKVDGPPKHKVEKKAD